MTDSPPKKRRRFQLHLSTCVVMMVVAGIFMALNFTDWIRIETGPPRRYYDDMADKEISVYFAGKGWPLRVNEELLPFSKPAVFGLALAIDVTIALASLGLTGIACESLIRRRERKRLEVKP